MVGDHAQRVFAEGAFELCVVVVKGGKGDIAKHRTQAGLQDSGRHRETGVRGNHDVRLARERFERQKRQRQRRRSRRHEKHVVDAEVPPDLLFTSAGLRAGPEDSPDAVAEIPQADGRGRRWKRSTDRHQYTSNASTTTRSTVAPGGSFARPITSIVSVWLPNVRPLRRNSAS